MPLRTLDQLRRPLEPGAFPTSPFTAASDQPLLLGLFLPLQTGGWSQSTLPRGTDWTFDYNRRLVSRAEELGFELGFGLSQWLPKGGFGGESHYRENFLDPFVSAIALAGLTRRMLLFGTVHVLYGPWHPLHLAKFAATADHISGGRFGMNIVTGYAENEPRMFGLQRPPHDRRYQLAEEFMAICGDLWEGTDELTYEGGWSLDGAYVSPRPTFGRPLLVSASGSPAGFDYAARNSDFVFTTSPGGEEFEAAVAALPDRVADIKQRARAAGREVRVLINPTIVCRSDSASAHAYYRAILDHADVGSIRSFSARHAAGDSQSWLDHGERARAVGGHLHVVGSPEEVADQLARLHAAGIDGVQLTFYDYLPDLEQFGAEVIPLLEQAGLRRPAFSTTTGAR